MRSEEGRWEGEEGRVLLSFSSSLLLLVALPRYLGRKGEIERGKEEFGLGREEKRRREEKKREESSTIWLLLLYYY